MGKKRLSSDKGSNNENPSEQKQVKEEPANDEDRHQGNVSEQYQSSLQSQQQMHLQAQSQPQQMQPTYPAYGYGVPDQYNIDPSQRSYPMIAPYNMYHSWPMPQMEGMGMPLNGMQNNTATGMEIQPNAPPRMNPYAAYMPMPQDMYGMMGNYCPYPMYPPEPMLPPVKEIITLTMSTLYPPHPGQRIKSRDRHPGCKTVFCGGLPEKITEEIIREIFERCGELNTIRMSKKNFCHIRFTAEHYVDEAMKLSGYRIKIENKDDAAYCGRLHVDYAKARDDDHEYECQQRALQIIARHQARNEMEAYRPPTPPPVVHHSEHEGTLLLEKLKSDDHSVSISAMKILTTWLDREECNKKNASNFYSLIQCSCQTARRLLNEKKSIMSELDGANPQMQQKMTLISLCFNDIYKVFETVQNTPKIWDSFTRMQKKEIEGLAEKTLDVTKSHSKEMVDERVEDEMELSDDEDNMERPLVPVEGKTVVSKDELQRLKSEMEKVKSEYEVALNENQNLKQQKEACRKAFSKIYEDMSTRISSVEEESAKLESFKESSSPCSTFQTNGLNSSEMQQNGNEFSISHHEILLISLIATFLNVHPFGASIDYICSYLIKIDSFIRSTDVEDLLRKFPNLFVEHSTGIGATLVKTWKFSGFTS